MSERVLVKISAVTKEQVEYVSKEVIRVFGKQNTVLNFPRRDDRTGFWYVFLNLLNVPMNPEREEMSK